MPKMPVADLEMYYEFAGTGDQLVVMISGLSGDHQGWLLQVPALTEAGYRCLLFDNRDAGQTDASPIAAYPIRQFADDTIGLMDKLNIEQAHILGSSMGGMIAQEMAICHPERVRTLTLVSTAAVFDAMSTAILESWKTTRRKLTFVEFLRLLCPWVVTYRFYENPANVEMFLQTSIENPYPQSIEAFLRQCDAIVTDNTLDRLERITAPTHVIVGDQDILTPPRHARTLVAKIPGARLTVIPEEGHAMAEKPDELNKAILGFLAEH
jgi:pimeloyl-ACP methyl ester carboxylesterase